MTPAEIGNIGERHVEACLVAKNYACNRNTQLPGSTDIEATAQPTSLLVQVKTAITPEVPANLAAEELAGIKARATKTGRQAWLAQVTITPAGPLAKEIVWTRLN